MMPIVTNLDPMHAGLYRRHSVKFLAPIARNDGQRPTPTTEQRAERDNCNSYLTDQTEATISTDYLLKAETDEEAGYVLTGEPVTRHILRRLSMSRMICLYASTPAKPAPRHKRPKCARDDYNLHFPSRPPSNGVICILGHFGITDQFTSKGA